MFRIAVVLTATCLAAALAPRSAVADPHTEQVIVRAYDTFGVTPRELVAARVTSRAILSAASIEIVWRDCGPDPVGPGIETCDGTLLPRELIVRIIAAPAQAAPFSLGYSLVDVQQKRGWLATIYANRVAFMARHASIDMGVLLGRAIAHELCHLLSGAIEHSSRGLMRARWDARELERDRRIDWLLLPDEAAEMRRGLLDRGRPDRAPAALLAAKGY